MNPLVENLAIIVLILGVSVLVLGLFKIVFFPLALIFEAAEYGRRRRNAPSLFDSHPRVGVVVPAYNEEKVLKGCVESIVASNYSDVEVILVDDGSSDRTFELMKELQATHPHVLAFTQANAGKGAALNLGITHSSGEVLFFVDADGQFAPDTIENMLRGFIGEKVGAVCGDDRPVNLTRMLTRLLTVVSHVGTGLVRRVLTVIGCLPIVSGNVGAFRREVIEEVGGFHADSLGEDLELTWRVHAFGYQVRFIPRALVYAESPSTINGLWRQRVRWSRGLLQTMALHWRMMGNVRHGPFGIFLVFNAISMVIMPVIQLVVLSMLPILVIGSLPVFTSGWLGLIAWFGLVVAVIIALYAIALNRAWADVRHLWTIPLWPIYSVFVGAAMGWAIVLQLRGAPQKWNKLERTGVVSVVAR